MLALRSLLFVLSLCSVGLATDAAPEDGVLYEGIHNYTTAHLDDWSVVGVSEREEEDHSHWKRKLNYAWSSSPTLATSKITTGVSAMQLAVVGTSHVLIIDKAENNPIKVKGVSSAGGKTHAAWVQWLDYKTGKYKALDATTNSFCAGGSFLSNGTMVSIGGNPRFNAASYYDANGLTSIRVFKTCTDKTCTIFENTDRVRLASARWYPGSVRLQDGSIMLLGGMTEGGFNNAKETDNPTIEYYPSKALNNGIPLYSKFLADSLNSNLFPVTIVLPGGNVFVAANQRAMIYNWQKNKEQRLKNLSVRVTYPWTAATTLLPLTQANNWVPTVLFCGGSTIKDTKAVYSMSSQTTASKVCQSMTLNSAGIKKGWQKETLPEPRVMGDAVLTPDGKVLILNGARTGLAGYANVHNPIGQSNADHPDYRGVLYDPTKALGKRISTKMPSSKIPRLYHSVATMTASGEILVSGSNPNEDVSTKTYKTEYRIEMLSPPYMRQKRPTFRWCPEHILFGKSFKLIVTPPSGVNVKTMDMSIVVMDFGYHTHGVGVDQRLLELTWRDYSSKTGQVLVKSPRDGSYFPPGRAWIFVVINGVPSQGQLTIMGDGKAPPFSKSANANMLKKTARTHGAAIW